VTAVSEYNAKILADVSMYKVVIPQANTH